MNANVNRQTKYFPTEETKMSYQQGDFRLLVNINLV